MRDIFSRVGAVILGAGDSGRMGADKILLPLGGKPLLAWSVDVCQDCEMLNQIIIVLNENNLDSGRKLVAERRWSKIEGVCVGGKKRRESVSRGLKALTRCDWVVIHDGARPFLTPNLIQNGLDTAQETMAATAAVPVKDTIKLGDDDGVVRETLPRQWLWAVQTPQVFHFDIISKAHERIKDEVTDDASLVERLGYKVKLYMGSYDNIKVTTPEDLALAEIIVRNRQVNASRNWL